MDRSIHILFTNLRVFGLACCALLVVAQGSAQTPSWRWSFGLASGDPEHFRALGVDDAEGSIYVVGDAENTGISIGPINLLDQDQGMLIKFDQWGNIVWYAPIGGSDQETAENIAVAPNGNVYVTGAFSGSCYFYNAGSSVVAHQLTSFSGSNDIYVAAFSPSGTFLWARQFGNGNDEGAPDIAADATGIALTGYHRNTLSISGNSSSGSLSTTTNSIFLIRFDLNGTLQWMVNGGTSSDDQPATIASDGTRIYVGLVAGNTNLRWYNTSNAQLNSSTQTRADHVIVAFNVNGTWAWGMSINDPSNSVMGYPNLVTTCDGVYVAGSVGGGSTFSSTTIAGTNALAYYMRLRPASGVMDWVRIGNAANSADRFNPRDIATGKNGLIHIGGTYNGTATYGTSTISSASGSDLFVLTVGTDGTFKRLTAINSDDEQYLSSIAADAYGGVIIAGSYEDEVNIPGYALSGPSSNENAFIGFAQLGDREPDATNPALFVAPTALCSGTAVDLSTWRVPNAAGTATAVTTSTNTTAPTNATLAWDNNRALLQGGSGTLSLDLGTIVPATEGIHIRWRRTPGSANAPTLRYETSVDGTNWAAGTTTTTRTNYLITVVTLTAPARYIRLTALTNGGSIDLDGVAYRVGTTTGGTWSGTNVSGSTFNPGTTATSASITYTTPGSCNRQHTASVAIQQAPVPGSITVVQDAATCPGNNHGSLTLSGTAAPVVRWESSTNNFATVETIANTTQTLAFANLDASRTYRAVLSGGTCGQAYSGIGTVNVVDNQPPVITCPGSITVPVTAGSCTATILYSAPVVTDNCNGSAPLELAQHTYLGTFQGHTYFRSWAAGGWTAANTAATSIPNGHLISVNSAAEEDWLNSVILTQTGTHAPFWIGLNDALSEGNFVWANGDPGSFSHWAASQPDDSGGADHVYMNMGNAPGWDDAPGTTNFNWIVEIDALPIIAPQLISGPASGSVLPAGTDTVRYMATDRSGNTSACRFTIAVIDQEPPVIVNTPTTILVNAGANCTAPATWTAPTVTDNCGGASISRTDGPSSGSAFPLGATNITYTAIDAAGNDTSSSFVVKVIDTQRPTALCKADTIGLNAYGVATVWPVHINAGSTDNCAITSMQVDPDTFTTTGVFNVRFIVADASGNRDSCNTTVTVVANNCIASLYLEGNTDGSHIPVGRLRNTAPTRAALGNYDPGADSAAGHLLKKGNGNVNENDERRYQIWLFPATTTSLNGPASLSLWTAVKDMDPSKGGHLRAYLVDLLADGSDRTVIATANIQRAIWHAVPAAWMAETFDFGTINHTPAIGRRLGVMLTAPNSSGDDMWIAYDALSFPATISIAANTPPEITCPPSQQVAITSATCGMVVAYPAPLFTDNCPGANMTRTGGLASGSVFPEGTTTNTYQVSDADGNTATCSFTVEVLDHSAPIITCPGNVTVEAASGACSALVGYAAAVFDNCVAAPTLIWSHAAAWRGVAG